MNALLFGRKDLSRLLHARPFRFGWMLVACSLAAVRLPAQCTPNQNPYVIPYLTEPVVMDGDLSEWSGLTSFSFKTLQPRELSANRTQVFMAWDEDALYAAFRVHDAHLNAMPKGHSFQTSTKADTTRFRADPLSLLYLNDSVELYIHVRGETSNSFGMSDYQVISDFLARSAILRGNPVAEIRARVPKIVDRDLLYEVRAKYNGTLNLNDDQDEGYTVEIRLPWTSLGVTQARERMTFRMQVALNDNDANTIFTYVNENWCNGIPSAASNNWSVVRLVGQGTWFSSLRKGLVQVRWWIGGGLGGLLLFLLGWMRRKKRQTVVVASPSEPETPAPDWTAPAAAEIPALPRVSSSGNAIRLPEALVPPPPEQAHSTDLQFLEQIRNLIESEIDNQNFNVAEMAAQLGLSPRQLQRKIQALTGLSPVVLLRNYRLERACQLLKSGVGNISEIAYAVGFNTPDYFAKVFKEAYGVVPSQYIAPNKIIHETNQTE